MEPLKHECGVAMIRLLKPLEYYRQKYGTWMWGLDRLYLLMEKQHNRGQEGAGVGVLKMDAAPGTEYLFRERALGAGAISEIFDNIRSTVGTPSKESPFVGEIYMGHLRYSTTGRSGMSYVHPFLRRSNWRSRNLLLCGNFNLTNVDNIFTALVASGQHPRFYSDTVLLLEMLGYALDCENDRLYGKFSGTMPEPQLTEAVENSLDLTRVLGTTAPQWDGGFVICGVTGSGDMFALRDAKGIRPAFYYADDEVVVLASERPVIQTVLNVPRVAVKELDPGCALTVTRQGRVSTSRILPEKPLAKCSFERIYFSRGSDADIYRERKALGRNLAHRILQSVGGDLQHTVFSFIPNTAEVAFIGMIEGMEDIMESHKADEIMRLNSAGSLTRKSLLDVMSHKLRVEKVALKDIKLRTFIAEGQSRNDLAAHVYDVTYGLVNNHEDTLVVIDDSIVRGTTLRQSILTMLDRLHPRKIVIVSSSPQVRYPDCYGIDMSRMGEFIAFRAAVALLRESGREELLHSVYTRCLEQLQLPVEEQQNCVKEIYAPFTDEEISRQIARMLTPDNVEAEVEIVYQTLDGLHRAVPNHTGDWYFSGNYPTPGGVKLVNRAYVNFYEGHADKR